MTNHQILAQLDRVKKQLQISDSWAKQERGDEPLPSVHELQNALVRDELVRLEAILRRR